MCYFILSPRWNKEGKPVTMSSDALSMGGSAPPEVPGPLHSGPLPNLPARLQIKRRTKVFYLIRWQQTKDSQDGWKGIRSLQKLSKISFFGKESLVLL